MVISFKPVSAAIFLSNRSISGESFRLSRLGLCVITHSYTLNGGLFL